VAALQACAEEAAKPPQLAPYSYRSGWQLSGGYGQRSTHSNGEN
jgi:hypothetical protein